MYFFERSIIQIFFLKICSSGGTQTIHKFPAVSIVKNCHPRTSLTLFDMGGGGGGMMEEEVETW